jgi:hypothetical protein
VERGEDEEHNSEGEGEKAQGANGVNAENSSETNEENQVIGEENKDEGEELKLGDLEEVVKIYDAFRAPRKKIEPGKDRQLEKEFEGKMSKMLDELKQDLKDNPAIEIKNACILKSRHEVLDIPFQKMIETVNDKQAAEIWRKIRTQHNAVVEGLLDVVMKIKPSEHGDAKKMNSKVAEAQKETNDVLEAAQHLESEVQKHVQEKEELKKQFESEKKELLQQIEVLEEENKKYLDTIIKRSKVIGVPTPNIGGKDSPSKTGGDSVSKSQKVCLIVHHLYIA